MESLTLKSTSLEADSNSAPSQNHAVLCTDDTTYNLRQVHSSNSVHLIVPKEIKANSHVHVAGDLGLAAVAQCATTLELIPVSADAISILKAVLPLYNGSSGLAEHQIEPGDPSTSADKGAKQELFDNMPLSRREFEEAWLDICAFETCGQAWVPSTLDCFGMWKSIVSTAILESVDLVEGFSPNILKDIVIKHENCPEDLFDAVLRRLCKGSSSMIDCSM